MTSGQAKDETTSPLISRIPAFNGAQTSSIVKSCGCGEESAAYSPSASEQDEDQYSSGEELEEMVSVKSEGDTGTPRSPFQRSLSPEPSSALGWSTAAPRISFGEDAPHPRWVFVEDIAIPHASWNVAPPTTATLDAEQQAEKSDAAVDDTVDDARPKYGMGVLAWKFEPGAEEGRNGLTCDRLYVHAYRVLEESLNDPIARDQLRYMIWDSGLAARVSKAEDPLPPLPPALGMDYLQGQFPAVLNPGCSYKGYARPSLARRFGDSVNGPPSGFLEKMRNHTWGSEGFSDADPEFMDGSELGDGSPSNNETDGQRTRESPQPSGDAVQCSEETAQRPIGGSETVDFDTESPEDSLRDPEAETTVENNGVIETPETSGSTETILCASTNVEEIAVHKRKWEDEVLFDGGSSPTRDTQHTATPACDADKDDNLAQQELRQSASPKGPKECHQVAPSPEPIRDQQPGLASDKTREQETKAEKTEMASPPKNARRRARKAVAARASIPLRRNPPRKVKRTHY